MVWPADALQRRLGRAAAAGRARGVDGVRGRRRRRRGGRSAGDPHDDLRRRLARACRPHRDQVSPRLLALAAVARRGRFPLRPQPTDATFISWPILAAAAACRLVGHLAPDPIAREHESLPAVGDLAGVGIAPEVVRDAVARLLAADPATAGEVYCGLPAEAKLALLVALVDAAADTDVASKAATEVHERREKVLESFEKEDKEQKRLLRYEREELRTVRAKLLKEAAAAAAATAGDGDEAAAEAAAAAAEEGVSEVVVQAEIARVTEANACLTTHHKQLASPAATRGGGAAAQSASAASLVSGARLTVVGYRDLLAAEGEIAMSAELQASGLDAEGNELTKRQLDASNARRDEMRRRRDVLPPLRTAALQQLAEATADGSVGALNAALEAARQAALEGDGAFDGVGGGKQRWSWQRCATRTCASRPRRRSSRSATPRRAGARRCGASACAPPASAPTASAAAIGRFRRTCRCWRRALRRPPRRPPTAARRRRRSGRPTAPTASSLGAARDGGAEPCDPRGARAPRQGGGRRQEEAAGGGDDDDDDDDDDVPLASRAKLFKEGGDEAAAGGTPKTPAERPFVPMAIEVPEGDEWARHVGEASCEAVKAALDDRAARERALAGELKQHLAALAARRDLRVRNAEAALLERERAAKAAAAQEAAALATAAHVAAANAMASSPFAR